MVIDTQAVENASRVQHRGVGKDQLASRQRGQRLLQQRRRIEDTHVDVVHVIEKRRGIEAVRVHQSRIDVPYS